MRTQRQGDILCVCTHTCVYVHLYIYVPLCAWVHLCGEVNPRCHCSGQALSLAWNLHIELDEASGTKESTHLSLPITGLA